MEEIISVVIDTITNKYADFKGRASRKEFWYFVLVMFVVNIAFSILTRIPIVKWLFFVVWGIVGLAILVPGIAVGVRRLHDVGKSGWFILIGYVPSIIFGIFRPFRWFWIILFTLIGLACSVYLIILLCQESQSGSNEYGPTPLS